jgi:hypothetical protein
MRVGGKVEAEMPSRSQTGALLTRRIFPVREFSASIKGTLTLALSTTYR